MTDYEAEDITDTGHEEWYVSDLQLAAELGKSLLERNNDLESSLRQQQTVIEEQAQEIQFLSRQSTALKEVNDSRLRIYEQLEVSVSELEKTNQKLLAESSSDKKRIKSLCNSIDVLESKCEELQKLIDELKVSERCRQKRERNRTVVGLFEDTENRQVVSPPPEFNPLRRRFSIENGANFDTSSTSEDLEVAKMRATVSRLKCQLSREERKSVDLQAQASLMTQENQNLHEQIRLLQEQQERLDFYHQAERLYLACHKCKDENKKHPIDDPDVLEVQEEFLLREKLILPPADDLNSSKMSQRNCISLLSELDAQYRAVIEKYEELLRARRGSLEEESDNDSAHDRCPVRTLSEELSEASDLSSGFSSSSERSLTDQCVQTDPIHKDSSEMQDLDSVTTHFNHSPPQYKQLFEEIFTVIKRPPEVHKTVEPQKLTGKDQKKRSNRKARKGFSPLYPQHPGVLCPQPTFVGFPVIRFSGGLSYAEALVRGSKSGPPIFKPR